MGMGAEKMALLRRYPSTFAVGDALVCFEGCCLATQSDLRRLLAGDYPRVEQISIGLRLSDVLRIRQASDGVFCSEARNIVGGLHRAL